MDRLSNRTARVEALERVLYGAHNGIGVLEMARYFEVHRSTVYRDIDTLCQSGVPIWEENGRYGILRDRYLHTVRVNLNEALCLYLSTRLLLAQSDKQNPYAVSALEKLAETLPEPLQKHMRCTAELVRDRPIQHRYVQILETLTSGWAQQKQVRIRYRSSGSSSAGERCFDPYFIEPSGIGYACYTIGHDHYRDEVRIFKVERIEQAVLTEQRYEIPESFDPHEYLSTAWGIMGGGTPVQVKLRFTPAITWRVKESVWHPSQDLQDVPDGGCLLTLNVSNPVEMKPWIRGWGPECEVLEPESLRTEIAEGARRMGEVYGG